MKGFLLAVCCLVVCGAEGRQKRATQKVFKLSNDCQDLYVNVDNYDEVEVKSHEQRPAGHPASKDSSCMAYFKTSQPDHGLCVHMQGLLITSAHVKLEMQTGPYGPERIIKKDSAWKGKWCFPHGLLAMKVMTTAFEEDFDSAAVYSFSVTNVSMNSISRHYYMDSFVECGLSHTLTPGQKVHIEAERDPMVTPYLPDMCQLTFESTSTDEYEQVCLDVQVQTPRSNGWHHVGSTDDVKRAMTASKALQIQGMNDRFYSVNKALDGEMTCSINKRLTMIVTRNQSQPFNFRATVSSQWHPNWETEATEASELEGLRVVKGITYFIATIDSLVAVLAAGLAAILKRPAGPWRRWAENFNAHAAAHAPQAYPPQDQGNYGSMHTCKDGNYPELPLEGATPTNEVLVEAHTY